MADGTVSTGFPFRRGVSCGAALAFAAVLTGAGGEAPPAEAAWRGRTASEHVRQLRAPEAAARAEAALALGVLAGLSAPSAAGAAGRPVAYPKPEELAAELCEALKDPDAAVRRCAVAALGRVLAARGADAQAGLAQVLAARFDLDADAGVRANVVDVLSEWGPGVGAAEAWTVFWTKAAGDQEGLVRRRVAAGLGNLRLPDARALELLGGWLEDEDLSVANQAAEASRAYRERAAGLAPKLAALLAREGNPDPGAALRALQAAGAADGLLLPALARAVREAAGFRAEGLEALRTRGQAGVALLREFLKEADLRKGALAQLARIGAPEAREALGDVRRFLDDPDVYVAAAAREALVCLTEDPADVGPLLLEGSATRRTQTLVRLLNRKTLPAAFVPLLRKAWEAGETSDRIYVLRLLPRAGTAAAETVVGLIETPTSALQEYLAAAVAACGPPARSAAPKIEKKLKEGTEAHRLAWRKALVAVALPEGVLQYLTGPDAALAQEVRRALLAREIGATPEIHADVCGMYARAGKEQKPLWAAVLCRVATPEQLAAILARKDDAALQRLALAELGLRGRSAAPALPALREQEKALAGELERARAEYERLRKEVYSGSNLSAELRATILRLERAAAEPAPEAKP
jgi:hypothetical protein